MREESIELKRGVKRSLSPADKKRKLNHEIEVEDKKLDNYWTSCVLNRQTDKRLLMFSAKLSLSIITLGFSFYQVATLPECSGMQSFFTGLISLIIGAWLGDGGRRDKNR